MYNESLIWGRWSNLWNDTFWYTVKTRKKFIIKIFIMKELTYSLSIKTTPIRFKVSHQNLSMLLQHFLPYFKLRHKLVLIFVALMYFESTVTQTYDIQTMFFFFCLWPWSDMRRYNPRSYKISKLRFITVICQCQKFQPQVFQDSLPVFSMTYTKYSSRPA